MPGYPLFLAAIYVVAGKSILAVRLGQIAVDLGTCGLIALLAWSIAPAHGKRRAALAALWLAALCPFIANYTAVVLSEVLATFWTAAAIVAAVWALGGDVPFPALGRSSRRIAAWAAFGVCVGIATLMRPETPIIMAAAGFGMLWKWWRPRDWPKAIRDLALMVSGLSIVLVPWAVRNWIRFHEFQPLVPRFVHVPGESTTPGFIAWSRTWLVQYNELDVTLYKVGREPIQVSDIPVRAFDSESERSQVSSLIEKQHTDLGISPALDAQFASLAAARAQARPFRTHLWIPVRRVGTIWFTPRAELLPVSSDLWPPWERLPDDPVEATVSLIIWILALASLVIGILGWWRYRSTAIGAFLFGFVLVRTAFFAWVHFTPEPRFVLECFPVLLACGGVWLARASGSDPDVS